MEPEVAVRYVDIPRWVQAQGGDVERNKDGTATVFV